MMQLTGAFICRILPTNWLYEGSFYARKAAKSCRPFPTTPLRAAVLLNTNSILGHSKQKIRGTSKEKSPFFNPSNRYVIYPLIERITSAPRHPSSFCFQEIGYPHLKDFEHVLNFGTFPDVEKRYEIQPDLFLDGTVNKKGFDHVFIYNYVILFL